MRPTQRRPRSHYYDSLLRLYAIASRFYPAAAVVIVSSLAADGGEHLVIATMGLIIGSSMLPQLFDLGMARRITMEAALLEDADTRDRLIASLTAQYIWFSLFLALPAIGYAGISQTQTTASIVPCLPLAVLLSCATAPVSVLVSAALYGWRRCSLPSMLSTVSIDLLLLVLLAWLVQRSPLWAPIGLAVALLFRQLLLCNVFGVTGIVLSALIAPRRAVRNLLDTARFHGLAELRLGLYCITAWGLDPFLYVYVHAPGDIALHLIATRVAQAVISVLNIVLIASMWRGSDAIENTTGNVITTPFSIAIVLSGSGLLALGLERSALGWNLLAGYLVVPIAVTIGTLIAIFRQHFSIIYMRGRLDVRAGARYPDMLIVLTLKVFAVQAADVVLLEFASVVASGLYLWRLSRAASTAYAPT